MRLNIDNETQAKTALAHFNFDLKKWGKILNAVKAFVIDIDCNWFLKYF